MLCSSFLKYETLSLSPSFTTLTKKSIVFNIGGFHLNKYSHLPPFFGYGILIGVNINPSK